MVSARPTTGRTCPGKRPLPLGRPSCLTVFFWGLEFFFFKSITYTYIYILICSFGFLKNHVYLQSLIYVIKKASGLFLKSSFRFTEEFHGKCEDFP